MPFLFIGSTGDHAGQCLATWAIARRLLEKGLKIGFFKPFGSKLINIKDVPIDRDGFLFKEVLNIQEPLEMICPDLESPEKRGQINSQDTLEKVQSLAQKISKGKDLTLIIGSKHIYFDDIDQSIPDMSLISELEANVVLVHRYRKISTTLYSLLSINSLLGDKIKGIILNRIPDKEFEAVSEKIVPISEKGGVSIVPVREDPILSLWTIREIVDRLKGQIISGEKFLDRPVEGMTVGASDLEGDLRLFKRVYNKIVLLSPSSDREKVAGILLTGNHRPADRVIELAGKNDIPLILVREDAFAIKENLDRCVPTLTPADNDKIIHFTDMLDRQNFLEELINSLEIG
jgi:uncharacterized protein